MLVTTFGLTPVWTGLGYGLGFAVPLLILLWRHPVGAAARADAPVDPGLESLLGKRVYVQACSAVTLALGGWLLITS